ncbi:MAG: permease [Candidatus Omnitrophota bacterium]
MLLKFIDWFFYELLNLSPGNLWVEALHFFIYDTIKIFFLLFAMISVIGVLRSFLPQQRIKEWLGQQGIKSNFLASVFGALTPFCSCSSIPIFLGFISAGAPLGVTFSFLITSPIINEYLLVLMLGYFGWKITLVYLLAGLLVGTSGGFILGKMHLEEFLERDLVKTDSPDAHKREFPGFLSRIKFGIEEAVLIIARIWIWIVAGVGIGAAIHNFVPKEMIESVLQRTGIFSVPLAVLIGVPIYGSCAAIVPIAVALFQKGVPLGTAMAFMMAVSALSLPEAVILRRAMKLQLITAFFLVVFIYIVLIGYLLNFLQPLLL